MKKLHNERGESLVEVLASIVIGSLSIALMFGSIMASAKIDEDARMMDKDHYQGLSTADAHIVVSDEEDESGESGGPGEPGESGEPESPGESGDSDEPTVTIQRVETGDSMDVTITIYEKEGAGMYSYTHSGSVNKIEDSDDGTH